jgi:hypothetical protein
MVVLISRTNIQVLVLHKTKPVSSFKMLNENAHKSLPAYLPAWCASPAGTTTATCTVVCTT